MSEEKKPSIRDKTEYINNLIKEQNGLYPTDRKAYTYLYDIVKFLIFKKVNVARFTSEIPEEIAQNIIIQVFRRFDKSILEKNNKDANLLSIFPYLSKCVHAEASKLKTTAYSGNLPRVDETLKNVLFNKDDIKYRPIFETEAIIKIEKRVRAVIKEIQLLIEENAIFLENKTFIVFLVLIAISRKDPSLFSHYPDNIRLFLKQVYNNSKDPLERVRFK